MVVMRLFGCGRGSSRAFGLPGQQSLARQGKHLQLARKLLTRMSVEMMSDLGAELSEHLGRVLARERVAGVEIVDGLLEISEFKLELGTEILAELLDEREDDGLGELALGALARRTRVRLENDARRTLLAQVREQVQVGRAQRHLERRIVLTALHKRQHLRAHVCNGRLCHVRLARIDQACCGVRSHRRRQCGGDRGHRAALAHQSDQSAVEGRR